MTEDVLPGDALQRLLWGPNGLGTADLHPARRDRPAAEPAAGGGAVPGTYYLLIVADRV